MAAVVKHKRVFRRRRLIDAIIEHTNSGASVRIKQDGLVHRLRGYSSHSGTYEFYCSRSYYGDGRSERETHMRITCIGCFASQPW